jgi:hypothetical protein
MSKEDDAVHELTSKLQSDMAKAGGRLPGLDTTQIRAKTGNNSIEEESTSTERKSFKMITTAENASTEIKNDSQKIPPAGGELERATGKAAIEFFEAATRAAREAANPKPRKWTEKAVDASLYSAAAIVTLVGVYTGKALVERFIAPAPKQLPAAPEGGAVMNLPPGSTVTRAKVA